MVEQKFCIWCSKPYKYSAIRMVNRNLCSRECGVARSKMMQKIKKFYSYDKNKTNEELEKLNRLGKSYVNSEFIEEKRFCLWCKKPIKNNNRHKKFCQLECRDAYQKIYYKLTMLIYFDNDKFLREIEKLENQGCKYHFPLIDRT
jgi:predicted nucleic acid-binding Zn ribbon protein